MTQFERSDWLRSANFTNIMIEYITTELSRHPGYFREPQWTFSGPPGNIQANFDKYTSFLPDQCGPTLSPFAHIHVYQCYFTGPGVIEWLHPCQRSIPRVGVTKPISSVPLFFTVFTLWKHTLAIEYQVYIWQASPHLSYDGTCQILMWFK